MIVQIEEGFALDLSRVESIEQVGKRVVIGMASGKTYRISFGYEALLKLWKKEGGNKYLDVLKNIDSKTFAPRI